MEVPSSAARTRASRKSSASIFNVTLVFIFAPIHVQHYFTCLARGDQRQAQPAVSCGLWSSTHRAVSSLKWESVDLEKNLLTVFAEKTHKIRPVPINSEARRVLEFWTLGRKTEFVFYNHETGKPFVDLKTGLALACRKTEIEGVTWHTLRHTFASRLLNRGVDIVTVQQLLGHSTVVVTMRYMGIPMKPISIPL